MRYSQLRTQLTWLGSVPGTRTRCRNPTPRMHGQQTARSSQASRRGLSSTGMSARKKVFVSKRIAILSMTERRASSGGFVVNKSSVKKARVHGCLEVLVRTHTLLFEFAMSRRTSSTAARHTNTCYRFDDERKAVATCTVTSLLQCSDTAVHCATVFTRTFSDITPASALSRLDLLPEARRTMCKRYRRVGGPRTCSSRCRDPAALQY